MNDILLAYELADKLEQGHWEGGTREQTATMLRQQANRLALIDNPPPILIQIIDAQRTVIAQNNE